jgi:tRNA U34 5-carboxymethylaminomethyl modifying enzyme MnmG/GidA
MFGRIKIPTPPSLEDTNIDFPSMSAWESDDQFPGPIVLRSKQVQCTIGFCLIIYQ